MSGDFAAKDKSLESDLGALLVVRNNKKDKGLPRASSHATIKTTTEILR